MLKSLHIQNFKSIEDLSIELGRVTVLIGANGSGKSNILEAVAFAGAAAADKLDHEFLAPRGIRVPSDPRLMQSAFLMNSTDIPVKISIYDGVIGECSLHIQNAGANRTAIWALEFRSLNSLMLNHAILILQDASLTQIQSRKLLRSLMGQSSDAEGNDQEEAVKLVEGLVDRILDSQQKVSLKDLIVRAMIQIARGEPVGDIDLSEGKNAIPQEIRDALAYEYVRPIIRRYLVYSPDYVALRTFVDEGQILPLGIRGEGLFAYVRDVATHAPATWQEVKSTLCAFDWFGDISVPEDLARSEKRIDIKDRFLAPDVANIDQRSTSEGFLYLLFLACLFAGKETPPFFAVDNVDTSFNPKLCRRLATELVRLAKENDKQAILTTHNPAILDGLNLHDPDVRLYTVSRNDNGRTIARRVRPPEVIPGVPPTPLSEAFLRGYLGGLPNNF